MREFIRSAREALSTREIEEVSRVLAKYNLGICVPHMHDEDTGEIVTLPPGIISCERNLKVSFEDSATVKAHSTEPVAWRWNGCTLEVCASCCTWD
jgi:hypothetical protein